jgi:hypothetical protein
MQIIKICSTPNYWHLIFKTPFFLVSKSISNGPEVTIRFSALVSFKKYMPPPLPYFKVNVCPLPLPHFASIFFAYLWSFRWPNYIVTLPRYFSFRLPHLNIPTGILSLTQLYRYTPEIFLFSTATFKYKYQVPLRRIGQEYSKLSSYGNKHEYKVFNNSHLKCWSCNGRTDGYTWRKLYVINISTSCSIFDQLILHLRGDDHDGIVTHGRSREFRMHMKNSTQAGSGCIRFNDLNFHQVTFAE